MYCSSCGREIKEQSNFCEGCGAPLKKHNDNEITFYNNNTYNDSIYQKRQEYVNSDPNEGKLIGVICALFVPLLISIFIGLIFKDPVSRKNYYKYFGITWLISIGIGIVILILIFSLIPAYETIFSGFLI